MKKEELTSGHGAPTMKKEVSPPLFCSIVQEAIEVIAFTNKPWYNKNAGIITQTAKKSLHFKKISMHTC